MDASTYLLRVKDLQRDVEAFFHPSNNGIAIAAYLSTLSSLHETYCLRRVEPDGPCLCTQSYGQASCDLHNYLQSVVEHEVRECPFRAKVVFEKVSPEGVSPLPVE